MKLIGCDRCGAIFPSGTRHTKLRIFDTTHDFIEDDGAPAFEHKELCPVCRSELDVFLTGVGDIEVADESPHTHSLNGRFGVTNETPKRTCEICGRVGIQRFIETETGWRCSPTAVKCPGNKSASDSAAKRFPTDVIPARTADPVPALASTTEPTCGDEPDSDEPTPLPPGVTAQCRDCPRHWNLTGIVLRHAVDLHEFKTSHMVDVLEGATA